MFLGELKTVKMVCYVMYVVYGINKGILYFLNSPPYGFTARAQTELHLGSLKSLTFPAALSFNSPIYRIL